METYRSVFRTVFGWGGLEANEHVLTRVILSCRSRGDVISPAFRPTREKNGLLVEAERMVTVYFRGVKVSFELSLDESGFSPFQREVYSVTRRIPYGEVRTYGEIAQGIGKPDAYRAVGTALGKNPLPLFIPCHRVIRNDGSLGGFSAPGGIGLKARILRLEGLNTEGGSLCPAGR